MTLNEIGADMMNWMVSLRIEIESHCECGTEPSGSISHGVSPYKAQQNNDNTCVYISTVFHMHYIWYVELAFVEIDIVLPTQGQSVIKQRDNTCERCSKRPRIEQNASSLQLQL